MRIGNHDIKIEGRLIRIGCIDGDQYKFLDDPRPILENIRTARGRMDLFTFMQRLPEVAPKYEYPMEWDNFAALQITTYEHWWKDQIGYKARNKAKQAEKHSVSSTRGCLR